MQLPSADVSGCSTCVAESCEAEVASDTIQNSTCPEGVDMMMGNKIHSQTRFVLSMHATSSQKSSVRSAPILHYLHNPKCQHLYIDGGSDKLCNQKAGFLMSRANVVHPCPYYGSYPFFEI